MGRPESERPFKAPGYMIWKTRKEQGYSLSDFAEKLEVSKSTITKLENSQHYSQALLEATSEALGCPLSLLFTLDETEERLLKALHKVPTSHTK